MFAAVVFALATTAAIAAPLAERAAPSGWATGYLENYTVYHTRYMALNCHDQHNTTFFDDCCHPLLATETLSADRPDYCTPNATAVSSAAAYSATASVTESADMEAASEYVSQAAEATTAASSAVADAQVQVAKATSTSTYEAPAQTSEASSNNGNAQTGGYATYFYQGGNAGACGTVHSDSDKVIAIDSNGWWPNYNSGGPSEYCGKWITITNTNNGKSTTAMVADVCPTCTNDNSLDLSVGAFTAIASESDGMVPISWTWA